MVSEPRKIVLTSLFVSAVAIAAYISQSGKSWLSADELGLERDNASAHYTRGDMVTGSVSAGPVVARSDSTAATAANLQAARKSLQRNDLVAAQAQLDAVRSTHRDDDQVLALQREVEARTKQAQQAQQAPAAAHGERRAQQGSKSARSSSPSSGKTGRGHESYFATHEHSNRASSSAKTRRAPETVVATASASSTTSRRAIGTGAPVVASASSPAPAQVKVVSNVTSAPAASTPTPTPPTSAPPPDPQARLTVQAAPVQSPAQLGPSTGALLQSDGGPKTRAEVRAEIARARADGNLPAFGNPDPAGPGGAPSRTGALGQ